MKKLLLSCLFLLCITTSCAFAATSIEFEIDNADYYVQSDDVTKITALAAPFIKNDRTMVPVRALCEAFKSTVGWDENTRTVTVSKGDANIYLVIGSDKITVNGVEKSLDCPAEIVNDITFIPLRAVSENLGYFVYYIDVSRQILIEDTAPVMVINNTNVPYSVAQALFEYNAIAMDASGDTTPKQMLVSQVYALLKEVYILNSCAAENNITLSEDENSYYAQIVSDVRADSTLNTKILSSAFVKYFADYNLASKYADFVGNSVEISDIDAKAYYEENFVCAKHVLIGINENRTEENALTLAIEVYDRAIAGEDFDILIDSYGEDPGMENNPQGYVFTKGEMVAEFEEASFSLAPGEISAPVKTAYGYHVIAKQLLPMDASYITSIQQMLVQNEYISKLNTIFSSASITNNISEDAFALNMEL